MIALMSTLVSLGLVSSLPAAGGPLVRLPPGPVLAFTDAAGALSAAAEYGTTTIRLASPRDTEVIGHSWSPDGRQIAVVRCRGRNCLEGSIGVMRADGTHERSVSAGVGVVWMPDGQHLLVDRVDKPGHWIVNVGDGSRRRFTAPGLSSAPVSPRLSPDGRWLLHLTRPYGRLIPNPYAPHHAHARNWLIVTDLVSGRSRKVMTQRGWYMIGTAPWAPDGSRFTFTRRAFLQSSGGQLYVSIPTANGIHLAAGGARSSGSWSPDGTRVAFNVDSACTIHVAPVDGGSPTRTLPFKGCLPTWRPAHS